MDHPLPAPSPRSCTTTTTITNTNTITTATFNHYYHHQQSHYLRGQIESHPTGTSESIHAPSCSLEFIPCAASLNPVPLSYLIKECGAGGGGGVESFVSDLKVYHHFTKLSDSLHSNVHLNFYFVSSGLAPRAFDSLTDFTILFKPFNSTLISGPRVKSRSWELLQPIRPPPVVLPSSLLVSSSLHMTSTFSFSSSPPPSSPSS